MARTLVSPDLVGREPQVAQLVGALGDARNRRAGTLLVRGEAGAGKTRLLREFLALARDDGATTLFGSCVEVSAGDLPFVPFRTALRHLVQEHSPAQMEALLASTWQDLHVLLPELAPGRSSSDATGPAPHVFEVVASVVSALSLDGHVVLVVDDAQWADQSTLQLLRYLNQAAQQQRVLIVVAYRGEELPADPARRKAFEELSRVADDVVAVDPFDSSQVADLVRAMGVELSASSMTRLTDRCAGLPFLVEELVAAERDGVTRGIPRRVRDVVRLRLGALSEDAQLVVALVAVAGRRLRHRVLRDAAQLPVRVFDEALADALSANILVADTSERTYGFRHDVAREIVHEDLLIASRIGLHVRLAMALQSDLPVDAYASRLCEVAHHWLQTDANEEHALRAALLAARASTRAHAHPEAARQYDQVINLWARVGNPEVICGDDLVAVSTEAAEACHWAGDLEAALHHVERALSLAEDGTELAAALHERRSHYTWLASGHLARGPTLLANVGHAATRERMRASDLMQSGRYAESVDVARSALALSRAASATSDEIRAGIILGVGLAMTGHPEDGIATIDQALRDASDHGSTEEVVAAHVNLAFVLLGDGQVDRAAEVALSGVDEAVRRGADGSDGALLAVNGAEALIRRGRLADAELVLSRALERRPPPALATYLRLACAEIDVLRGRLRQAADTLSSIADSGLPEDFQFQLQMRAVAAELWLWDPAGRAAEAPDGLRAAPGSEVATGLGDEDVPLVARLLWLGIRADADARSVAEISGEPGRIRELVLDGESLRDRATTLAGGALSKGTRQQLDVFLALIAGEVARLTASPDPACWAAAAAVADGDPYLLGYALWRRGSALRDVRRRREAGEVLREAYRVVGGAGIQVVADAVVSAGHSLGIHVDDGSETGQPARPAAAQPFNLTAKEIEVLQLLVQGCTNRRVATALRMTEKTASVHVSRILTKLAVGSRGEAVARAYEVGLARPPVSTGE